MPTMTAELDRELAHRDDLARRRPHAPERSLAQRAAALERANTIRCYRADLKRDLKRGHDDDGRPVTICRVLESSRTDPMLATMKLYALLVSAPGIGRVKGNRVLQHARISPSKTVAGLTMRQRQELDLVLRMHAPAAYR